MDAEREKHDETNTAAQLDGSVNGWTHWHGISFYNLFPAEIAVCALQ